MPSQRPTISESLRVLDRIEPKQSTLPTAIPLRTDVKTNQLSSVTKKRTSQYFQEHTVSDETKPLLQPQLEAQTKQARVSENTIPFEMLREIGLHLNMYKGRYTLWIKTKSELEEDISKILGSDPYTWSDKLQRPPYKLEELGRCVYKCLRPILPSNIAWLRSDMIYEAMQRYDDNDELDFVFYFPMPASQLISPKRKPGRKKSKLGFCINTDTNPVEGSHWVGFFIDTNSDHADYFDSFGGKPNGEVHKTIVSILNFVKEEYPESKVGNRVKFAVDQKQTKTVECAMFVLFFLVSRIFGKTLLDISQMNIDDEYCRELRTYFFTVRQMDTSEYLV